MKKYIPSLILVLLVTILLALSTSYALGYSGNVDDHKACPIGLVEVSRRLKELEIIAYRKNDTYILAVVRGLLGYINSSNISCMELLLVDNIVENMRRLVEIKFTPTNISTYHVVARTHSGHKKPDKLGVEPPYYTPVSSKLRQQINNTTSTTSRVVVYPPGGIDENVFSWINQENTLLNLGEIAYRPTIPVGTHNASLKEDTGVSPYMLIVSAVSLALLLAVAIKLFRPKVDI